MDKRATILLLIVVILSAGCIEPYVRTADVVLFRISPDGEIEWDNTISCPDIFHTSPYIRVNAAEISGEGYFVLVQYTNRSLQTITRAIILDEKGDPEKDVVVPAGDTEFFDLFATGEDTIIALSRNGLIYTFDSQGEIVSTASFSDFTGIPGNPGGDYNSVALDNNGDLIFAGSDEKPGYIHILRVSLQEKNASEIKIKIGGMPWINSIIRTKDNGCLLGGSYSDSGSFPYSKPWASKADSEGNLIWENKFGDVNSSFLGFYEDENGDCHVHYSSSVVDKTGSVRDEYVEDIVENDGKLKDSVYYSGNVGYPRLIAKEGLIFTDYLYETAGRKNIENGIGLQVTKKNVSGEKEWETLYKCTDTSDASSSIGSGIIPTDDGGYLVTGTKYYF